MVSRSRTINCHRPVDVRFLKAMRVPSGESEGHSTFSCRVCSAGYRLWSPSDSQCPSSFEYGYTPIAGRVLCSDRWRTHSVGQRNVAGAIAHDRACNLDHGHRPGTSTGFAGLRSVVDLPWAQPGTDYFSHWFVHHGLGCLNLFKQSRKGYRCIHPLTARSARRSSHGLF